MLAENQKLKIEVSENKILLGRVLSDLNESRFRNTGRTSLNDYEFKVFSQFGDDGIIQFLVNRVQPVNKIFIEFGVENYDESNTKFLLINNNWKGLVLDGGEDNVRYIKNQQYFWRQDLKAGAHFITKENINQLISQNGIQGPIGILHIDLDGNDYWILETINVVTADILILEYNSVYGSGKAWTVPYQADFYRTKAHYSNLYWGASLKALYNLATAKGYAFVGCNEAGNNAFFIRKEIVESKQLHNLVVSVEEGFRDSLFRESRDKESNLTFLSGEERLKAIKGMVVYDVEQNKDIVIGE
ncbi:MAG: hypothetical protein EOP48_25460 [Sphingobacteriales bacterium]|nr:MAG: hypothetical protein EOP48_25460 [Sphingobacteriales bacterium]